ncbi:MAG: hypothetical protein MEP57_09700 [Microvirga sp.]|nr:hypothetical protein [Microvirga sp.]
MRWGPPRNQRNAVLVVLAVSTPPWGAAAHWTAQPTTREFPPMIARLHGLWIGSGPPLLIDVCRMQARFGDERPFDREPLWIRDVTVDMVVIAIGTRPLVAHMDSNAMVVTGPGIEGVARLARFGVAVDDGTDVVCDVTVP